MLKAAAGSLLALSVMISSVTSADDRAPQIAVSAPASALVRLSDAELDKITAGDAQHILVIWNPGNASGDNSNRNNQVFINFVPRDATSAFGVSVVTNPGHPSGTVHCIARNCGGF